MTEGALFIGWGPLIPDREIAALDVFKEATTFYEGLLKKGEIAAFEPVLLSHVGGPFYGFFLLRGDATKLAALMSQEAFMHLTTKASLVCANIAVIPAFVGSAVSQIIDTYRTEINTLALQHQHA